MVDEVQPPAPRRYVWPRFVLAGVILGFALAVLWMSVVIRRTREQRDPNIFFRGEPSAASAPVSTNAMTGESSTPDLPAEFRGSLRGGDAALGRKIFFERPEASCGKCHRAGGQGGDTGPPLDGAGARLSRERILEAMLFPNRHTLTNYETVIVLLKSGSGCSGLLKSEDETNLVIHTPDEGLVTIRKSDIQVRQKGASPMPEGLGQILSKEDLRDLVEFVAGLKP